MDSMGLRRVICVGTFAILVLRVADAASSSRLFPDESDIPTRIRIFNYEMASIELIHLLLLWLVYLFFGSAWYFSLGYLVKGFFIFVRRKIVEP